ncbi:MAG TPA: ATP-binding protein [Vicinamibacteria bacterium]|nr:ATP-binding protein [Vicinamibacteria bacterium]
MKEVRVPAWLAHGVIERYHAGASHLFLLHGNVRDVHPFGPSFHPLAEGLRRLTARRRVAVSYDVSSGLVFADGGGEKAMRKALGLKGALPADPARAFVVLDALVTSDRFPPGSVAVVVDYAHTLAPADGAGAAERQSITTLARWASDPVVAARRPLVVLIAPQATDVSAEVHAGASGAEVVAVPRPELEARIAFARDLRDRRPDVEWGLGAEELAAQTGGLSLVQIEDIVQRVGGAGGVVGREAVVERKIDLLRQEYGDVLEILSPRHGLDAVGGLDHAVREMREVADLMRRGLTSAAPLGMILMGPPGTGKTYLAECFARECGMLCVRFRPLRQMYVGQSERNQEKAFAAIRALAPVVVIVDESDQAEGGRRDAGGGDSGVAERMRASSFNFWADNALRGRVLRIDSTNRVDLIDTAMRRSGRTDVKIPILMPDETARRQIFEVVARKHKLALAIPDFTPFAHRTPGFTGSDIELALTTAYRFALREASPVVTEGHLTAALDDFIPEARDQAAIDHMTLLALDECRNRRLLPANAEAIRGEIEARRASRAASL